MNYSEHLKELRKFLSIKDNKKGLKHSINKKSPILPFPTRNPERVKFLEGFNGVTGEFSRIISGNTIDNDISIEAVIENMTAEVNPNEEDKPYFEKLVRTFLTDDLKTMKVFHPYILQYIPLAPGKESKGEKDIALFIRDVLFRDNQALNNFFDKSNADHLMTKLILNQLDYLKKAETSERYHQLLSEISEVFQEDIIFLTGHREYFLENIHLFLGYYYFFYIIQVTLKLNQMHKGRWDSLNEVVYTLDWESSSKNRIGYDRGYRSIKEASRNVLVHVNCLEHLNFLFGTTHAMTYPSLKNQFESMTAAAQGELIEILRIWIAEYRYHNSLEGVELSEEYEKLVIQLYDSLDEGISSETKGRYSLSVEEIGKRYFLKTRGVLGYMLNITQDFLLLLTAISVKKERKSLKEVFYQFELRGVFLDRYSKEAVVELFDKINILDKKSDSGDAQYVKPIL